MAAASGSFFLFSDEIKKRLADAVFLNDDWNEIDPVSYTHLDVYKRQTPASKVKVAVIPTNEELAIARETVALV